QPVPAHRRVLRGDLLERPARQIAGEDDVHDVLARERPSRGDRVDKRYRPLERDVSVDADLLVELAPEGLYEALASVHAAAGGQPVALVALLVPAEQQPVAPPQHGRNPDARLAGHVPEEPKPAVPRSVSGRASTSTGSGSATGTTTSCAIRMPGSTVNG